MGEHTITVKGHGAFPVEDGTKLVLAIEGSGVDISHRCGGEARCTTCRVQFLSEEPPMGETERAKLGGEDVLGLMRLSCQIRVDRDMEVDVLMHASKMGWEPGPEPEP